jgi:hypothetical protein
MSSSCIARTSTQITLGRRPGQHLRAHPRGDRLLGRVGRDAVRLNHYPFENKDNFNPTRLLWLFAKGLPGRFYRGVHRADAHMVLLHARDGCALFGKLAFRNVVSTGTILAADGSKMSKSKGNYTDPINVMDQFGADALRLYLMGSVVMSGEDFNFRDEDVREAHNRVIGILWNCINSTSSTKTSTTAKLRLARARTCSTNGCSRFFQKQLLK